jgi:UPF0042 nucleotide-binding protein
VAQFLENYPQTQEFVDDIRNLLLRWLPAYEKSQRTYMTIAIGCTGGQHRSVYTAETIYRALKAEHPRVQIRHRELSTMVTA